VPFPHNEQHIIPTAGPTFNPLPPEGGELKNASPIMIHGCVETENPGGTDSGTVGRQDDLQRLAKVLLELPEADRRRLLKLLDSGQ